MENFLTKVRVLKTKNLVPIQLEGRCTRVEMTDSIVKNFCMSRCRLVLGCLLALSFDSAFAASGRQRMAGLLIDSMQGSPSLFQGTPITHIVPEFNTVTYALDLQRIQTIVLPDYRYNGDAPESLTYSGWKASPYLALSLKKIGIGFNVEAGKKSFDYVSSSSEAKRNQNSTVNYRGLGIYLFYKPFDWKDVIPSFTLGGKSVNSNHEFGTLMTEAEREAASAKVSKVSYSIVNYSVGLNTQLKLVKPITVIPWADYLSVDDSAAHSAAFKSISDWQRADYEDDLKMMWSDRRALNYGIDFAIDTNGFQLRFGGLLGSIASGGLGPEYIKDQGIRIAFAWNQKAK